jgi:hypothetical protein
MAVPHIIVQTRMFCLSELWTYVEEVGRSRTISLRCILFSCFLTLGVVAIFSGFSSAKGDGGTDPCSVGDRLVESEDGVEFGVGCNSPEAKSEVQDQCADARDINSEDCGEICDEAGEECVVTSANHQETPECREGRVTLGGVSFDVAIVTCEVSTQCRCGRF